MNEQPTTLRSPSSVSRRSCRSAPDAATFWQNIRDGRYCITDVPPERWDPELYYDPDPTAPDKTYSRIGGWVRDFPWEPMAWRLPLPPKVAEQMDVGQQWAVSAARSALLDAGWPDWHGGPRAGRGDPRQRHRRRQALPDDAADPLPGVRPRPEADAVLRGAARRRCARRSSRSGTSSSSPTSCDITEDTMPGELSNVHGRTGREPVQLPRAQLHHRRRLRLRAWPRRPRPSRDWSSGQYDAVVTGGVDRNMGVNGFVKFCKIGALSATGTRPFDAGADGFVMGEGAALFVLKRLADAERDGDRIYAVLLGLGGSSDGKGKGITAPNPVGQRLAVERAWANAGLKPAAASAIEAHGTSTRVGDAAELGQPRRGLRRAREPMPGSIALGSVKSNIGHLKAAAGAAGLFKMVMQLHDKHARAEPALPRPQPERRLGRARPFRVNTELREWPADPDGARAGRRQRVRLRRHELPRGARGVRARPAPRRAAPPRSFASAEVPRAAVTAPTPRQPRAAVAPPAARCAARWCSAAPTTPTSSPSSSGWPPSAAAGSRPGAGSPRPRPRRCRGPRRHRLRRRRRPRRQDRQGGQGVPLGRAGDVEDAARPGRLRRPGPGAQGGVPLHRPGLAVRQHAQGPAGARARRRRDVRRGGPDHDARCSGRPLSSYIFIDGDDPAAVKAAGAAAAADRDHPAGRAHHRPGADPAARAPTACGRTW